MPKGCRPSLQRNLAAAGAAGEILYFLDDDSRATPGFLTRATAHLCRRKGGRSRRAVPYSRYATTRLQQAFGMVFAATIGGGGMRNRYRQTGEARTTCDRELILCNLSFRRDVFLRQGGFDERLYPNEENELMDRIRREGGILVHDPDLAVHRSQRRTLTAFCRQFFGYGRGRGEQTIISRVIKPITFIPSLFLIYLLLLPLVGKLVYSLPLLCYVIVVLGFALHQAVLTGRLRSAAWLPAVIPLFHVCYGAGMLRGLALPRQRQASAAGAEVTIRRVKEFGRPMKDEG